MRQSPEEAAAEAWQREPMGEIRETVRLMRARRAAGHGEHEPMCRLPLYMAEHLLKEHGEQQIEIDRLKLQLRAQSEAFIQRVQGWAQRLRALVPGCDCPPRAGPRTDYTRSIALHGQLVVELLRYSGAAAPGPSAAAADRLRLLQEGAAQVAAAARGWEAWRGMPCAVARCSRPAEGMGIRDGAHGGTLQPLCRRHGEHARLWEDWHGIQHR